MLELLRPDEMGLVHAILSVDTFSAIRDIKPFRLPGSHEDLVMVVSDSGRFAVLRADEDAGCFRRIHLETYGKSGSRRITPGQFLAADPRGRAAMACAVEKQKLAWILSRDSAGGVTISSPLEAHKPHSLCVAACGLDVGFESPLFACLELSYEAADGDATGAAADAATKVLAAYELDLGLNHVSRRWAEETDRLANAVVAVPGGEDGPGGCLVLAEGWVLYHSEGQPPIRAPIPRRRDLPDERDVLLTAHCSHSAGGGAFFTVAQSELGDLYRVSLEHAGASVSALSVQYLDTIAPCTALALTRTGLLLASTDGGDQLLYEFQRDGADEEDPVVARATAEEAAAAAADGADVDCPAFKPRPLTCLSLAGTTPELAPLTALLPADTRSDGETRLLALAGRGSRAGLRVLRHGAPAKDLAVTQLRGVASGILSVRVSQQAAEAAATATAAAAAASSDGDAEAAATSASEAALAMAGRDLLLVVSFVGASMALRVGEEVEELPDSGLQEDAATLAVGLLDDGSLVQVCDGGLRRVKRFLSSSVAARIGLGEGAVERSTIRWVPPGGASVRCGFVGGRQVLVCLDDGAVLLFELDPEAHGGDSLVKVAETALPAPATCIDAGERAPGARLCPLLAVADETSTLRVLSLSPASRLAQLASQLLPAAASDLCIADLRPPVSSSAASSSAASKRSGLSIVVGLATGVLLRSALDAVTGRIAESTSRIVGARPVRLARTRLGGGRPAVLAMSSRPWLVCISEGGGGRFVTAPLATVALDGAAALSTAEVPEGIAGIANGEFRVTTVDQLGGAFAHDTLPLRYTPRRVVEVPPVPSLLPRAAATATGEAAAAASSASASSPGAPSSSGLFVVVESDHNAFTQDELEAIRAAYEAADAEAEAEEREEAGLGAAGEDGEEEEEEEEGFGPDGEGSHPARIGRPVPPEGGKWASCVRLVDTSAAAEAAAAAAGSPPEDADAASAPGWDHPVPGAAVSGGGGACTLQATDLPSGAAALSACGVQFASHPGEAFVAVGVVTGLTYHPSRMESASVRLYRVAATDQAAAAAAPAPARTPDSADRVPPSRSRAELQLVHETPVSAPPLAMCAVAGRLLVGLGPSVVAFDLGKRQLLRRAVSRVAPTRVVSLVNGGATAGGQPLADGGAMPSDGQRVWCGDGEEGVLLLSYRPDSGAAVVMADELTPRHVTGGGIAVLDADTVVVGDKFGSVAVVRAPDDVEDDGAAPEDGAQKLWAASPVAGARSKLVTECQVYVGGAVTAVSRTALAGGHQVLLYATVTGAVGALLPLTTKSDARLLEHLEMYLRARAELEDAGSVAAAERLTPTGRVHVAYRSSFAPVKHVIDGDLCERFLALPEAQRASLAEELSADGGPVAASTAAAASAAIARRLEEMRARVM